MFSNRVITFPAPPTAARLRRAPVLRPTRLRRLLRSLRMPWRRQPRRRVRLHVMRDCLCACEAVGGRPLIRCTRGVAWVTQPGDPADFILRQRDTFAPDARGTIVVHAIENCTLVIAF